jgi:hypothetical protein
MATPQVTVRLEDQSRILDMDRILLNILNGKSVPFD